LLADSLVLGGIFCDLIGALVLAATLWVSRSDAEEIASRGLRSGEAHVTHLLSGRVYMLLGGTLIIVGFGMQFGGVAIRMM